MSNKRAENGEVQLSDGGARFVPADVIAKISGVSLRDVSKVIAAIQAVTEATGVPTYDLTRYTDTPLALPDESRSAATLSVVEEVKDCWHNADADHPVRQFLDSRPL